MPPVLVGLAQIPMSNIPGDTGGWQPVFYFGRFLIVIGRIIELRFIAHITYNRIRIGAKFGVST